MKLLDNPKAKEIFLDGISNNITNVEIAKRIEAVIGHKFHHVTIGRLRQKLKTGNRMAPVCDSASGHIFSTPPANLPYNDKADWFREQFRKSHLYVALIKQFNTDEVRAYMEEYGQICTQFEDIVVSEYFQIDDFLKHRLLINRQLEKMKALQTAISEIKGFLELSSPKESDSKEDKAIRMEKYKLLGDHNRALDEANTRYDKLVAERQKIYQNLAATRRDRVDELKTGNKTFFDLVADIRTNDKSREQHGKYAELTRLATDDMLQQFRTTVEFPDGQNDCVILDSETVDADEDVITTDVEGRDDE
jgi:hypothetical protein